MASRPVPAKSGYLFFLFRILSQTAAPTINTTSTIAIMVFASINQPSFFFLFLKPKKLTTPAPTVNTAARLTQRAALKSSPVFGVSLSSLCIWTMVVDIQWYEPGAESHQYRKDAELVMDEYGRLLPAANRFPSAQGGNGFRPLADYVHSLGLKFGIHILRGIPRQAIRLNTEIKGSGRRAAEIADFGSVCQWNGDM